MTSDMEATTDDLQNTIRELWQQAQGGAGEELAPPDGFGQSVTSVKDTEIAEASGLDLEPVREYLENADGTLFVVGRDGESRSVQGLL
ncbi:hypothetical protein [Nocardioides marmotae]|uniref:hypothetical protein n=1 Tax=Nocardioides marmotae TaxID=2663857 RepID=UPI0012B5359A|nr:hypothetical protein [Nocardioides marmotae]MBC9731762.1 hypothetical protein [Nocardioides marmotae]MTB82884.1 hypothetical protein [Nocardioides marmotae]